MKIPIVYIILAVIVIGALLGVRFYNQRTMARVNQEIQRDYEAGLVKYREHVQTQKDGILATKRGWQWLKAEDPKRAIIILERARQLEPNYREAAVYLGYAHLQSINKSLAKPALGSWQISLSPIEQHNELAKAKEALKAGERIDPLWPLTNQLLGLTYEKLGDDNNAKLCYDRFKALGGK